MNLLWLESSIPPSTMAAWVSHEVRKYDGVQRRHLDIHTLSSRTYENSLAILAGLHILPQSTVKLTLNSVFKNSLRHAIVGG